MLKTMTPDAIFPDITEFCRLCRIEDTEAFLEKCRRLFVLLSNANQQCNLTAIRSPEDFMLKHIADSISIAIYFPALAEQQLSVADIGCGAGFPSLVLAAAYPRLRVTAMDSIRKKTVFVRDAASQLRLDNLQTVTGRAREFNRLPEWREQFDVVTARAVSSAVKIYRETRNFPKPTGRFILYKTPEQALVELPEIRRINNCRRGYCWKLSPIFELSANTGKRQFLYTQQK